MAIITLEIKARQALAGGREFGAVGRYTQLDGTAHFLPSTRTIPATGASPTSIWRRVTAMAASASPRICGS
jgi:hypothetical protein